ncbi:hypothetical protein [Photobacterium leiognathi]|uniref:hypothetical protein n=1 Tax=Photobacterium leiognathi TaxID=553611 RepID=UPI0027357646|nr:hypothetical protein [Photobacterium leiognathi]
MKYSINKKTLKITILLSTLISTSALSQTLEIKLTNHQKEAAIKSNIYYNAAKCFHIANEANKTKHRDYLKSSVFKSTKLLTGYDLEVTNNSALTKKYSKLAMNNQSITLKAIDSTFDDSHDNQLILAGQMIGILYEDLEKHREKLKNHYKRDYFSLEDAAIEMFNDENCSEKLSVLWLLEK